MTWLWEQTSPPGEQHEDESVFRDSEEIKSWGQFLNPPTFVPSLNCFSSVTQVLSVWVGDRWWLTPNLSVSSSSSSSYIRWPRADKKRFMFITLYLRAAAFYQPVINFHCWRLKYRWMRNSEITKANTTLGTFWNSAYFLKNSRVKLLSLTQTSE